MTGPNGNNGAMGCGRVSRGMRVARRMSALGLLLLASALAPALAQTSVTNAARVANPAGVTCSDAATNPACSHGDGVTTPVVAGSVPDYDFCPAGGPKPVFSIVNGVRISQYLPGAASDAFVPQLDATVNGNLNGLMIDPVRNRLLFVSRSGTNTILWAYDAGNGGWYQATAAFASPDFPRAGMTPSGVGYLIAGGSTTPAVWRIDADPAPGSFGYTVQSVGTLTYDTAPTDLGSGDIAFDGEGAGWLSAGQDLYRIDFALGLTAVRQTRPLLGGAPATINWAGVAFAEDGRLYVADNTGGSRYYAYDPATGVLTPEAPTVAAASRDLASCAFPVLAEAEFSVVKTLAQVNGAPAAAGATVSAGDVLTYAIAITNDGGAAGTLFAGDIVETLPANTTVVTAGNDFTCSGSTCPNTAAVNVAAGATATLDFVVEVVDPLPAAVTAIDNAVVVEGVACTDPGNDCAETTPVGPTVTVAKTSDVGDGNPVSPGDTLAYTVQVVVANAPTTGPLTLTDTLGNGLSLVAVTAPGAFTCNAANPLVCVLPAGTAPGSYPLVYTATVDADATASVSNSVVPTGDDAPVCAAGACETTNPISPSVSVEKSADPSNGTEVAPGDTVTYTLTATVANSATTEVLTLTDTLGDGLGFGAVTAPGAFTCAAGDPLVCTLPAGTLPGSYAVTYTATVDTDAAGTVGNSVVASNPPGGDPDPVCTTCTTEHPIVAPAVTVAKAADPATGTSVVPGEIVTYTLTATITNSATTEVLTLTDTLGDGLAFGAVTAPGAFTCAAGEPLVCTLPAGTLPGSYALSYTASVDADATGTVGNSVVASNPPGGDPDPVCTTCTTEHPIVAPAVTVVKAADPASGTDVGPGDTVTYTLTATVTNSATTEVLTLTDTLGDGLGFGAVTAPGAFTCVAGDPLVCTLPAGTLPGTYPVSYTATVDADATGTVGNSVVASNPPGGDPDPVCTTCSTEHPIVAPTVSVVKTADPASGSEVVPGDTVTYTLTATVANSATTEALTLTDTLGTGLGFGSVTAPGAFTCVAGEPLVCTLPAGTLPGTYAVTYTATIDADATGSVGNSVVASNPPGGDPDPVCTTCSTEHPIVAPAVSVVKSADPATGTDVVPGDTVTYTLTATVTNSATTEVLTLTDTLGNGLGFGAVTAPGAFTCAAGNPLVCTLPAGTLPGSYAVSYTATVDADATGTVGNSVVASNPPGGDPDPVCTTCTTEHPITDPSVTVTKSAVAASGTTVAPGETITYTLTATITNSAITEVLTLTDSLGDGLSPGAVTVPGAFTCAAADPLVCTLPAGTLPGTYAVSYTATVDADATGTVGNDVVASNPPGGDPDPVCTTCSTEHPIVDAAVTVAKTSDPAPGTEVAPGDTVTYTLTATVANSATTDVLTLTDTLGDGLGFGAVTAPGAFTCAAGTPLVCTLPAGTLPGTYAVSYTATVDADATGTVGNSVVASNPPGGDPDPVCTTCSTEHPVVETAIEVAKSADPAAGTELAPGDTVTYTLMATVSNSATTEVVTLTDTLGDGLTFAAVTAPGAFTCAGGNPLVCTLPAGTLPGTYPVSYTVTVDADATGTVANSVIASNPPGGDPDPVCTTCSTEHPVVATAIEVVKSADPASGSELSPGDTVTYTLTATVSNSATTEAVTLTDTLGAGLGFGTVTAPGAFTCAAGNPLVCTLPAGTLPGTYPVSYTATVDADATGTVGNSVVASNPPGGDPDPVCTTCSTEHPVIEPEVTYAKSVALPEGNADGRARPGDVLTYTLRTTVANSATTATLVLTDTLGAGLTLGAVTAVPPGTTCNATNPLVCTLPAGLLPGSYDIVYTATVDADATGSVRNAVLGSGDDAPTCEGTCSTETPIADPRVSYAKTADPAAGEEVAPGDTIRYTLSVTVAESATTADVVLTDTLGAGLAVAVLPTGCTAAGQVVTCVLGTGALPGTHLFDYTATVDADATVSVANTVVASGGGGDEAPECAASCRTEHPVVAPAVTVAKSSDPASGETVRAGDEIAYTLTVTVANSSTTEAVVLVDTLTGAHALIDGSVETPAGGTCAATATGLECSLAAGALPGTHSFTYRTRIAADATGEVGNAVVATGGGGSAPECTSCSTTHRIADPVVTVSKLSDPASGAEVAVGDTLVYTLSVTVSDAATLTDVVLVDTPDPGLTLGTLPAACSLRGSDLVCVLPAGSVPGTYTFQYPATVNANASGTVANVVVPTGGGRDGTSAPECASCATTHEVSDTAQLRIVKTAGVRQVRIGDLVRYTLQVENVGTTNVRDVGIVDTAAAGFSYVDGSLAVADLDDHGTAAGHNPIRFDGIDIDAGETATLTYLMRVGAGVRTGTHVNQAQAWSTAGDPVSNVATAEVQSAGDPLLDESLVFGTVFDDRDRDGWQDDGSLSGLHVQGGFAPDAYVPGSTTIDRGNGHEPVADASAPLLHGIALGSMAARQSEGDPASRHQVVVRQRLRSGDSTGAAFTGDFVLRNDQGVTVRMDAAGTVTVEKDGEAAKGLNAAAPHVERRVAQGEGGLVVDYVIRNDGIDDRGIPGVRIASVEGLLVETDQYGRYHLLGIEGGAWERGRNFILKVDPSTLPPGSEFTTDNPLLRRVTPGLPVRFDFGVTLPVETFEGGVRAFEIELGEVPFAAGSAVVEERYLPAITQIAAKAAEYDGGEVVIRADGEGQALAFERAEAVRTALVAALPADRAQGLTVVARGEPGDPGSLVAGASADGPLLGTVLFDTDRTEVRPEFASLLDRIAASLEQQGGGVVVLIGHADRRASDAHNVDLGLRRARAVYDAIATRLSPDTRSRVRVESSNDPAAPAGARRK